MNTIIGSRLTIQERITKAHISMMRNKDWVWLGPTCLIGKVHITQEVPTAATDGLNVLYNPEFLKSCTEPQLRATVVHENMHKALLHMSTYKYLVDKFGPEVVNAAMDYVINKYIVWDKLKTQKNNTPLYLDTWDGIIQYLYDPHFDDEMVWDTPAVVKYLLEQNKGGGGKGKGKGNGGTPAQDWQEGSAVDAHQWAEAQAYSQEQQEKIAKEIEQALRQGRHLSKKLGGGSNRAIDDLLAPAVDWRQPLRDFALARARGADNSTWARPNRRHMAHGMYLPSHYTDVVERLGLFIDTSGSIGAEDLRDVLSEVAGIVEVLRPKNVDIAYWDTSVQRYEHYEGLDVDNIMSSTKPAGGGGTSPQCVVDFFRGKGYKFDVVIWLSDGYTGGDWGEGIDAPAFWVITHGGTVPNHLPHVQLPRR